MRAIRAYAPAKNKDEGSPSSADGSTLYVAESQTNSSTGQGVVHKVDLASGTVSNVNYGLDYLEGGSWWTAISTGSSFTTTKWDTWSASANWVDVLAADFTGTGTASITGRYFDGGSWWAGISSGFSFNTTLWTLACVSRLTPLRD